MSGTRRATTAQRLNEIMTEKGLRQVDLLERCQPFCEKFSQTITKSHISQWVNGINAPSQSKLTILALALGVSEAWLLGLDTKKIRPGTIPANISGEGMDNSLAKTLLTVGIEKLDEKEAQRLLDLAKVVYPDKFDNNSNGSVER